MFLYKSHDFALQDVGKRCSLETRLGVLVFKKVRRFARKSKDRGDLAEGLAQLAFTESVHGPTRLLIVYVCARQIGLNQKVRLLYEDL